MHWERWRGIGELNELCARLRWERLGRLQREGEISPERLRELRSKEKTV